MHKAQSIDRLDTDSHDCGNTAPGVLRPVSQCIDWYGEGESRVIDVGGVQVTVRFIGRKGRRARIAITAPPNAVFCTLDAVTTKSRFESEKQQANVPHGQKSGGT